MTDATIPSGPKHSTNEGTPHNGSRAGEAAFEIETCLEEHCTRRASLRTRVRIVRRVDIEPGFER